MRIGIIGDTHIPFCLDGYLEFCQETFEAWDVERVIHIGDLIDNHSLSFHDSEPALKGANGEYLDAMEELQPWYDAFPKLELVLGNHDLIPARQLKKIGMDCDIWLRPLKEIYNMPKGWKIVEDVTIDNVLYHHGDTACGVNGFRNDSIARMCSTVTGHAHGNAGVSYTASNHRLIFGLAVGCGVDNKSMAMVYGKKFKHKPIVSCGIVIDGKLPVVEVMDLGEN